MRCRHHRQPLADIFQLPHIAGPAKGTQHPQGICPQLLGLHPQRGRAFGQKMLSQQRNVLHALGQRGQAQADHVQAVEEVIPKEPLGHARLQVLMRGGNHPHTALHRLVAPHAVEVTFGQHPQQPRLHLGRHVADLLLQGTGQGGGDGLGHGGAHVLPHRQGALDPSAAAPGLPLPGGGHELGGGIEPQVGHLKGLARGLRDRGGHRGVTVAARLLEGQLLAHLPVDRLGGGGGEHLLELGAHRQQLGGTELGDVPHPRHLGDGAGIHPG